MSDLHDLSATEKRRRGQEDLICGVAPGVVASRYGVNPATVSGWHTPEIHAERDKRRAEAAAAGRAAIADLVSGALKALKDVAEDEAQPGPARVAAANSILDRSGVVKTDEITIRVEEQSATDVAAGLLAILGRAQAEIDRAPPAETDDAEVDPDAE
jgi:hypothetical protein